MPDKNKTRKVRLGKTKAELVAELEAEINPLVIKPKGRGAVAVDGLIVVGE